MNRVEVDPSAPGGYRIIEQPNTPARPDSAAGQDSAPEPTLEEFRGMSYNERVELHRRDTELYRRLSTDDYRTSPPRPGRQR